MRDVAAFRARLRELGIELRVRTDARGRRRLGLKATRGSLPPEIRAEAKALEAELLTLPVAEADPPPHPPFGHLLPGGEKGMADASASVFAVAQKKSGRPRPNGERVGVRGSSKPEPPPTADRPDRGPPPADRSWRRIVALWPIAWRRRWGRLAIANEHRGDPWDVAEWRAFHETARDLAAAEDRGKVPEWSYPL